MSPFSIRDALLAKHAQHVVLIHFPIALFIVGAAFDFVAYRTRRAEFAAAAYYNFLVAAIFALPVVATGLLAWQIQLEGQKPKGILLLHLVLGLTSGLMILLVWHMHWHWRSRRTSQRELPFYRLAIEFATVVVIAVTAHLGGFLSGVNLPS
jgi:uncharacterized membrane protein